MGRNIFTGFISNIFNGSHVLTGTLSSSRLVTHVRASRASLIILGIALLVGLSAIQKSIFQSTANGAELNDINGQSLKNDLTDESLIDEVSHNQTLAPTKEVEIDGQSQSSSSVSSHIRVNSSVQSNGVSDSSDQTTVEYDSDSDQENRQTIIRESEDGRSSVRYDFNVNSDSDVNIRERGGRIKIEINEKTEN